MIEPTPDVTAQLVRIKQSFQIANTFAARDDPANRVLATILLDYVAESVLKTVYWSHPKTCHTAKDLIFSELLGTVAALTGSPPTLPLQTEMRNLHAQRNLAQHRNLIPSGEDVSRHASYVERFLRELLSRFFGVHLDALSLTQLVESDELRTQLEVAEASLARGDFRASVEEAARALRKATIVTASVAGITADRGWTSFSLSGSPAFSSEQQRAFERILRSIEQFMGDVEETLRAIIGGVDWATYLEYRTVAPRTVWTFDGSIGVIHRRDDYSEHDAQLVFAHALAQILRLQDMGSLSGPLPPWFKSSARPA